MKVKNAPTKPVSVTPLKYSLKYFEENKLIYTKLTKNGNSGKEIEKLFLLQLIKHQ